MLWEGMTRAELLGQEWSLHLTSCPWPVLAVARRALSGGGSSQVVFYFLRALTFPIDSWPKFIGVQWRGGCSDIGMFSLLLEKVLPASLGRPEDNWPPVEKGCLSEMSRMELPLVPRPLVVSVDDVVELVRV